MQHAALGSGDQHEEAVSQECLPGRVTSAGGVKSAEGSRQVASADDGRSARISPKNSGTFLDGKTQNRVGNGVHCAWRSVTTQFTVYNVQ